MPDTLPCKPATWLGCAIVQTTGDAAGIVVHRYEAIRPASGFLAVFAAGLALQRVKERSRRDKPSRPAEVAMVMGADSGKELASGLA